MTPYANHDVYLLPPQGGLAAFEAALQEAK